MQHVVLCLSLPAPNTHTVRKYTSMQMLISDLGDYEWFSLPSFSILSTMSMRHFYGRWPLFLASKTGGSRLCRRRATSAGNTVGSYQHPLQWRPFFQKRPDFLSVFSRDENRVRPTCCLCKAWWGFRWVWTCLSRHCSLLWKAEEGQIAWGLAAPRRTRSRSP